MMDEDLIKQNLVETKKLIEENPNLSAVVIGLPVKKKRSAKLFSGDITINQVLNAGAVLFVMGAERVDVIMRGDDVVVYHSEDRIGRIISYVAEMKNGVVDAFSQAKATVDVSMSSIAREKTSLWRLN